jgi:hypothetical protein
MTKFEVATEQVLAEEGYEYIVQTGDDLHAVYYEAVIPDDTHELIYEIKRTTDDDLYRRQAGGEDWYYMFSVQ